MYNAAELANEKRAYPDEEGRRVQVEHDSLRASLDRLDKESSRVSERLVRVVQPAQIPDVVPMPAQKDAAEVPISPLAARLRDDRRNVDRISERLSDLCDRLEV